MRPDLLSLMPLWRALRSHSLTFAVVFASTILGASIVRALRHVLRELSAPWLLLWILPIALVGAAAKREKDWVPDAALRRKLALGIALGSIALSILIGLVRGALAPEPEPTAAEDAAGGRAPGPRRDHRPMSPKKQGAR